MVAQGDGLPADVPPAGVPPAGVFPAAFRLQADGPLADHQACLQSAGGLPVADRLPEVFRAFHLLPAARVIARPLAATDVCRRVVCSATVRHPV